MDKDKILNDTLGRFRVALEATKPPELPGVPDGRRQRIAWFIANAHMLLVRAEDELVAHIKGESIDK
jgi:hypothetical protein